MEGLTLYLTTLWFIETRSTFHATVFHRLAGLTKAIIIPPAHPSESVEKMRKTIEMHTGGVGLEPPFQQHTLDCQYGVTLFRDYAMAT